MVGVSPLLKSYVSRKPWTTIDRLLIVFKASMKILREKNYVSLLLHAVLNKSWKLYPIKQQLNSHLSLISLTIQERWTRYARHCKKSMSEYLSDSYTWIYQCWQTSKNLHPSVLCGHRTQSREHAKRIGWERIKGIHAQSMAWG